MSELFLVQAAVKNGGVTSSGNVTTCERAVELSKTVGARVFWRPGGVVNWMLPEMDAAEILSGED